MINLSVPHLTTVHSGDLFPVEAIILNKISTIEAWFRMRWQETPAPLTSSVDLRHSGAKLAPVDTNLFPAGFNNLTSDGLKQAVVNAKSHIQKYYSECKKILIIISISR